MAAPVRNNRAVLRHTIKSEGECSMQRQKQMDILVGALCFGVLMAMAYLAYRFLIPALLPFLIATFIASHLKKLIGFFVRHSQVNRRTAAAAAVCCFYGIIMTMLWLLIAYSAQFVTEQLMRMPELYATAIHPSLIDARQQLEWRLIGVAPEFAADMTAFLSILFSTEEKPSSLL